MKWFKYFFLLTLILVMYSCADQREEIGGIVLSGKIENPNSDFVVVTLEGIPDKIVLDTVYLNGEGQFILTADLDECRPARFFDGKESTLIYLCPGDSLHISLNTTEFDESLKYVGKGADRNNFLAEYYLEFLDFGKNSFIDFFKIRDTAIKEYVGIVQQHQKRYTDYLEKSNLQSDFPKEFVRYMKTRIYFGSMENYIYLFYSRSLDTSDAYRYYSSQVKTQIVDASGYDDPDYLSSEYQWWLYSILPHVLSMDIREKHEGISNDRTKLDSIIYERLEELLTPYEFQIMLFSEIRDLSLSYDLKHMNELKPIVTKYVHDPILKNRIDSLFIYVSNKLEQAIPDHTTLYDLDSPELEDLSFEDILDSYRGKIIYLDFWASWCGPCKAEMPYSAELASKFEDDDAVFLYMSTDKDSAAWENMIKIMQLHGIHYRLGKNTRKPVFDRFGIKFIPHYVLFDQEGEMVKNNMTRPSQAETESLIRELLQ